MSGLGPSGIPSASGRANDLGQSGGEEAVHQTDADVNFCGLAVWTSCGDAFSEGLQLMLHLDTPTSTKVTSATAGVIQRHV
jgi:hypothetical protein